MLKIHQSKLWQKDFAQYKRNIEKISNEDIKKTCYNILNQLSREYAYIDAIHDVSNKSIDPTKVRENVETSLALRKKLNKLIKDSQCP